MLQRLGSELANYIKEDIGEIKKKIEEETKLENEAKEALQKTNLTDAERSTVVVRLQKAQQNKEFLTVRVDGLNKINEAKKEVDEANLQIKRADNEVNQAEANLKKPITPEGVRVHAVQVEFAAGNLKNVIVIGTMKANGHNKEDSIKFINANPIPFSAIRDFNYSEQLYSFNHNDPPKNYRYRIHLSDVFRYIPTFYVDAEDYSPADIAFTIKMDNEQASYKVLSRSSVDKLLDARIYSDFVGFDDDSPNGLIQTEVSKRIILRPNRKPIILNRRPFAFGGIFNYIEPSAALTKIENKDKYLPLNIDYDSLKFISGAKRARSIDLLRYSNFNIGAKLNLLVCDLPLAKSSFFLDLGTQLFRTGILDSVQTLDPNRPITDSNNIVTGYESNEKIVDTYNANSLMSFLELTWQLKSDHRLGLSISPRISYFDLKSPRFQQVAKLANTDADTGGGTPFWMCNVQINAFLVPSANGRFFLRTNYTFMYDNMKQDFFQAQIGYAFNILKRKPGN